MPLHEWQETFQANILTRDALPKNYLLPLVKQRGATAQRRLNVYIDAYSLRLASALRTNYPVIHELLGDNDFDAMARRYLAMHPPRHASIRWFGANLSLFLRHESPYSNLPVMAELAAFEWAMRHTIDAADCELLTAPALQAINPQAWSELAFNVHPSLTTLNLQWNAPQLWTALSVGEPAAQSPPVRQAGTWLIFRRPDLVSHWRSATSLEISALEGVISGLSFGQLCEQLAEQTADIESVPLVAATFLRSWVEQGLLSLR